jgi:hypothetical protein
MVENQKNKIRLEDISKNNPFKAPEGYFDNFGSRMTDRILTETDKKQYREVSATFKPRLIGVVTLSVAALVVIGLIIFSPKNRTTIYSENELAEIYE